MVCVGVLALQGDFTKHAEMLCSLNVEVQEVRKPNDLQECDGLIIPGGESTVILRQLEFMQMREPLVDFASRRPVFGTCAGLILMSKEIQDSLLSPFQLLDVTIERNAYGRQVDSFQTMIALEIVAEELKNFPAFFIRAPRIKKWGDTIEVLATWKEEPVLVRQGHHLGASFHPELTKDPTIHQYFIEIISSKL